jgi:hypothetical protein
MFFLRRRARRATRKSSRVMIASPPTTPPAMAPTFGFFADASAVDVGADVSVPVAGVVEFVADANRSTLLQEI